MKMAHYNNLECLIYLHENDCPWDEKSCEIASNNGQLECLIYLHHILLDKNKRISSKKISERSKKSEM